MSREMEKPKSKAEEMRKNAMKKAMIVITIAVAMVFASACKKEKAPAPQQQAKTPQQAPAQSATAPTQPATASAEAVAPEQAKKQPAYTYTVTRADGKPKRDPFQPIPVQVRPTTEYEVTQMGVTGVIIHGIKKAAVMTPNCATSFVVVGDPIGIHDGRVVDITLDGVLVRETFIDVNGQIQQYERLIPNKEFEKCK